MKIIQWDFLVVLVLLSSYIEYDGDACDRGNSNPKYGPLSVTRVGVGEEIHGDASLSMPRHGCGLGVRIFGGIGGALGAEIGDETKEVDIHEIIRPVRDMKITEQGYGMGKKTNGAPISQDKFKFKVIKKGGKRFGIGVGVNGSASVGFEGSIWGGGWGSIWGNRKNDTEKEIQDTIGNQVNGETAGQVGDTIQGGQQCGKEEVGSVEIGVSCNDNGGHGSIGGSFGGDILGENGTPNETQIHGETVGEISGSADIEEENGREEGGMGIEVNSNGTSGTNGSIEGSFDSSILGENGNAIQNESETNEDTANQNEGSVEFVDEVGKEDGGIFGIEVNADETGGIEINDSIGGSFGGDILGETGNGTRNETQVHGETVGEISGSAEIGEENGREEGGMGIEVNANGTSGINGSIEGSFDSSILGENGNAIQNESEINEDTANQNEGSGEFVHEVEKEDGGSFGIEVNADETGGIGINGSIGGAFGGDILGENETHNETQISGETVDEIPGSPEIGEENGKEEGGMGNEVNANGTSGINGSIDGSFDSSILGGNGNAIKNESKINEDTASDDEGSVEFVDEAGKEDRGSFGIEVNTDDTSGIGINGSIGSSFAGGLLGEILGGLHNETQILGGTVGEIEGSPEIGEENGKEEGGMGNEVNANGTSGINGSIDGSFDSSILGGNGNAIKNESEINEDTASDNEGSVEFVDEAGNEDGGILGIEVNTDDTSGIGINESIGSSFSGDLLGEIGGGLHNETQILGDTLGEIEGSVEIGEENGKEDGGGIGIEVNADGTGGIGINGSIEGLFASGVLGENRNITKNESEIFEDTVSEDESSVEFVDEVGKEDGGIFGIEVNADGTGGIGINGSIGGAFGGDILGENGTHNETQIYGETVGEIPGSAEIGEENGKEEGGMGIEVNANGTSGINESIEGSFDSSILGENGNAIQKESEINEDTANQNEVSGEFVHEVEKEDGGSFGIEVNTDDTSGIGINGSIGSSFSGGLLGEIGGGLHNETQMHGETVGEIEDSIEFVEEDSKQDGGIIGIEVNADGTGEQGINGSFEGLFTGGIFGENGNESQKESEIYGETIGEIDGSVESVKENGKEGEEGIVFEVNTNGTGGLGMNGLISGSFVGDKLGGNGNDKPHETLVNGEIFSEDGHEEGKKDRVNSESVLSWGGIGKHGNVSSTIDSISGDIWNWNAGERDNSSHGNGGKLNEDGSEGGNEVGDKEGGNEVGEEGKEGNLNDEMLGENGHHGEKEDNYNVGFGVSGNGTGEIGIIGSVGGTLEGGIWGGNGNVKNGETQIHADKEGEGGSEEAKDAGDSVGIGVSTNATGEIGIAGSVGGAFEGAIWGGKEYGKGKESQGNGGIMSEGGQKGEKANEGNGEIGLSTTGKGNTVIGSSIGGSLESGIFGYNENEKGKGTQVPGVASNVHGGMVSQFEGEVQGGQENGVIDGGIGGIGIAANGTLGPSSSLSGEISFCC